MKEELPELPKELQQYLEKPYGGLFGDDTQIKIIEEIVADPYSSYNIQYFENMIGSSIANIKKALDNLINLGLLGENNDVYHVNLKSKKLVALTFLSLALIDDRDGTECMDYAILDYMKINNEKNQGNE